jgi:hypothetical protein
VFSFFGSAIISGVKYETAKFSRFPPLWSVYAEEDWGKLSKLAVQKSQPHAHHDNCDQNTEYCNFRTGHSVIPLTNGVPELIPQNLSCVP